MERHLDTSLRELKQKLLGMGGCVERMIEHATDAMQAGDLAILATVHQLEKTVNQAHMAIDTDCIQLLALQQPLAADLRLIVAVLKINTDLERMGDQAVNIAYNAERYLKAAPLGPMPELTEMSAESRIMVREALDSFVRVDEALARHVLKRDDKVDAFKNTIFRDTLDRVKKNPQEIEQGLNLILIARNLERIGDHATNIAEDVIYAISGDDVRHAVRPESVKGALK